MHQIDMDAQNCILGLLSLPSHVYHDALLLFHGQYVLYTMVLGIIKSLGIESNIGISEAKVFNQSNDII